MNRFTATEIEQALQQESFTPVERVKYRDLTETEQKQYNEVQKVVSLGNDVIGLFDAMLSDGELFPQKKYVDRAVNMALKELTNKGINVEQGHVQSIINRCTSTYMSKMVELHVSAMIAEMDDYKEIHVDYTDSIMGVDHVVSNGEKLLYVHVTSDSGFAKKMLNQKENRGGWHTGKTFIPYSRDFNGDVNFFYNSRGNDDTKLVNGFPLLKQEHVEFRLNSAFKSSKKGEYFKGSKTKLDNFIHWMEKVLGKEISKDEYRE